MAVHAMTKAELDQVERREQTAQQDVLIADPPGELSNGLTAAAAILVGLNKELGPLAASLVDSDNPVSLLWRHLFAGYDAAFLRLLQVVRLADGYAPWPDPHRLGIGGDRDDLETLVARQVGRAAALTARWQRASQAQAGRLAPGWPVQRYRLAEDQHRLALAAAAATDALLDSGWGEARELPVPYSRQLALHHRLRMLFVEYAGLTLIAHLRDEAGLPRIDRAALQGEIRQEFPDLGDLARPERRWALYRWLARQIQRAYAEDPDCLFQDNEAIWRKDPLRATITDTISGPFFTRDARLARDQSNLHWSHSGLGREEENSFFQTDFSKGIFRCVQTMLDDLARYIAATVIATGRAPTYLYDGASGSGAVARCVLGLLRQHAPELASAARWQLTDVSAGSLQAAWAACADLPELSVHLADLAAPMIAESDHGTFDVAGQNLGAHHLPDEEYASMIRRLVALTRPGGLIYLGDVDDRIGLQVLNGLWANLYAVEWPRTSSDPYLMFPRPSLLAIRGTPFDHQQAAALLGTVPAAAGEEMYKIMVPLPQAGRAYPAGIEFYTTGFGYVSLISKPQLDRMDVVSDQGQDWRAVLGGAGTVSAELARHQAALADRLEATLARLS
jgi:hypothetical protein